MSSQTTDSLVVEHLVSTSIPLIGNTPSTIEPGQLYVIKRNGHVAKYSSTHIATAMKKAFLAVEGEMAIDSSRIQEIVASLTQKITNAFYLRYPSGGAIHIEAIQDKVELTLMQAGLHKVARAYVLYREERRKQREDQTQSVNNTTTSYYVTHKNGQQSPLDLAWLDRTLKTACDGLSDVSPNKIMENLYSNLCEKNTLKEIYQALLLTTCPLLESEPNYTYVAARLLLQRLYEETLSALALPCDLIHHSITDYYKDAFKAFLDQGIAKKRIHPDLTHFNWDRLAAALLPERDRLFTYMGLQTLTDRYFIRHNNNCLELPQVFFMRVAMGLAQNEKENRDEHAIAFYLLLSSMDFMSSTPTLFNSGTVVPQLSSCFLTTVSDDLPAIFSAFHTNALLAKYAGGLGNDWTPVRATGAGINGTHGVSLGIIPFLNVADATAIAVNQGGKRKGAVCAYLEIWHMDIEDFLELRKNTGDERRRTHDMNTANWVPDLFMKRLFENKEWTLFSPDEVPDLHELYGIAFEKAYVAYEEKARSGIIRSKTMPAVSLWRKMLGLLFETGHPWITFKDACNLRSPQQHVGVIHSSNLCTEITLNTSAEEVAVCNLGSINLVNHIQDGQLNMVKLKDTIKTAMRMLDNVIDINYYSVPQAKASNLRHRPIGLGLMGFQDALYLQRLPYASQAAINFADTCMEQISYYAIAASVELAKERGSYSSYTGSLWDRGILPIDSIALLAAERGGRYLEQNTDQTLDWNSLRQEIKRHGIRNSNVMAIAPTATIGNICGISPSIEPAYQNLFVKSNLSGEFTVLNAYLVQDLKKLNLWDNVMVHDIKYYNGSIKNIDRIPAELKTLYATAFEIEPHWLVEAASRRQKWIDQAQSLNLYLSEPSGKKIDALYRLAWLRGLKTTYYLRSMGATHTEKATIRDDALNAVHQQKTPPSCSIDDSECEACQ